MSPKITEKREKMEREREREKKRLATVLWTLEIVFERQKTSAEGHSQILTKSDLVFINPGIYIYIYKTLTTAVKNIIKLRILYKLDASYASQHKCVLSSIRNVKFV